jgi:hypothetical protein
LVDPRLILPSKVVPGLGTWTGFKKDYPYRQHLRLIEKHRGKAGIDICVVRMKDEGGKRDRLVPGEAGCFTIPVSGATTAVVV